LWLNRRIISYSGVTYSVEKYGMALLKMMPWDERLVDFDTCRPVLRRVM